VAFGEHDIFQEMARLRRRIEGLASSPPAAEEGPWAPPVDIRESERALVLSFDLPGLRREDIELRVDRDGLTLQGERPPAERLRAVRLERPAGPFRRSFRIGIPINPAGVQATYRDGVLEITIPKAEAPTPTRVNVDTA